MLERISELKSTPGRSLQFNTVYLTKQDGKIIVEESPSFQRILHNLNVSISRDSEVKPKGVSVYTEDKECIQFTKALLKGQKLNVSYEPVTMGCNNYIELGRKKST